MIDERAVQDKGGAGESANGWQPALLLRGVGGHMNIDSPIKALVNERFGKVNPVRARIRPFTHIPEYYVCGTQRCFEVHPDDAASWGFMWGIVTLCEHQILTD